jgi:hypothetical protein
MKEQEKIVAHIYSHGDPSVGMGSWQLKNTIEGISIDGLEECCENARNDFREHLKEFFAEWLDNGKVDVWFDDECADCGVLLIPKKKGKGYLKHKCSMLEGE